MGPATRPGSGSIRSLNHHLTYERAKQRDELSDKRAPYSSDLVDAIALPANLSPAIVKKVMKFQYIRLHFRTAIQFCLLKADHGTYSTDPFSFLASHEKILNRRMF